MGPFLVGMSVSAAADSTTDPVEGGFSVVVESPDPWVQHSWNTTGHHPIARRVGEYLSGDKQYSLGPALVHILTSPGAESLHILLEVKDNGHQILRVVINPMRADS